MEGGTHLSVSWLLPPRQATAAGDGHGHFGVDRVLRDDDVHFSGCIPGEGAPFPGPPSNRHPGGAQLRWWGLGNLRCRLPSASSQSGLPGLGGHRQCHLQRGLHRQGASSRAASIIWQTRTSPMNVSSHRHRPQLRHQPRRPVHLPPRAGGLHRDPGSHSCQPRGHPTPRRCAASTTQTCAGTPAVGTPTYVLAAICHTPCWSVIGPAQTTTATPALHCHHLAPRHMGVGPDWTTDHLWCKLGCLTRASGYCIVTPLCCCCMPLCCCCIRYLRSALPRAPPRVGASHYKLARPAARAG